MFGCEVWGKNEDKTTGCAALLLAELAEKTGGTEVITWDSYGDGTCRFHCDKDKSMPTLDFGSFLGSFIQI